MLNPNFLNTTYKGKRVFITGHTGFKGAWLLYWLHLMGADLKGYALAPANKNDLFNLIDGDSLCQSVLADIRNKENLEKEIIAFQPDFVFHLAAQPLVRDSYTFPIETFETNALGSAYLLESLKNLDKPCTVVMITTDKVYENKEWEYPYRENDRLGGHDPYSSSKACAELIIASYRNSFFSIKTIDVHQKAIAVGRAGNVIGGGDWATDRIIPDTIRALIKDQPVPIRNPVALRPWQHVLEPLGGYLLLGARLTKQPLHFSDAWNFGPFSADSLNVEAMVNQAIQIWGHGHYEIINKTNQVHEAGLLQLDISKAVKFLKWKPKYATNETISKTMEWYKNYNAEPRGIKKFTENQITDYHNLLSYED